MPDRFVWHTVVAPWWRVPFRPVPGLGGARPWLRWLVVREIRPVCRDGIISWGYEHHSLHWTFRAAHRAARAAQSEARHG